MAIDIFRTEQKNKFKNIRVKDRKAVYFDENWERWYLGFGIQLTELFQQQRTFSFDHSWENLSKCWENSKRVGSYCNVDIVGKNINIRKKQPRPIGQKIRLKFLTRAARGINCKRYRKWNLILFRCNIKRKGVRLGLEWALQHIALWLLVSSQTQRDSSSLPMFTAVDPSSDNSDRIYLKDKDKISGLLQILRRFGRPQK